MRKKSLLSGFVLAAFVMTIFSLGGQKVNAEIASGITVPSFNQLQQNSKFPDPFKMLNGNRMTTREQWTQRRNEVSALAQTFEYGIIPGKPQSVKGSFSSNKITVTVNDNGKTTSFDCSIQYPSTGKAPYPAMIGCNMNSLNTQEILKLGVACITLPGESLGGQSGTRAQGKFYQMYGSNHSAGSIAAWVWGASRLIDALEVTPEAKINPAKLGVTGGSRNGKGALAIGAFEERIALTIPQESGCGGAGNYRLAEAKGSAVQRIQSLVGEQPWFSKTFDQFSYAVNKLPYDHHQILGLVAPRGLLLLENPDYEWLHTEGCYNNAVTTQMIYEALGVKSNFGISSVGGHMHCSLPQSQFGDVNAFIKKFLLDDNSANTNIFKSDKTFNFNKSQWIDWTVPSLTGTVPFPGEGTTLTTPPPTSSKLGDVDGDGQVNSIDFGMLRQYLLGIISKVGNSDGADLNKDGEINSIDFGILRKSLLGQN